MKKEHLIWGAFCLICALFSFYVGKHTNETKNVSEIADLKMRIQSDSLQWELKKKDIEIKFITQQNKLEHATPEQIDSVWNHFGF